MENVACEQTYGRTTTCEKISKGEGRRAGGSFRGQHFAVSSIIKVRNVELVGTNYNGLYRYRVGLNSLKHLIMVNSSHIRL
jgi:hypothetical protein